MDWGAFTGGVLAIIPALAERKRARDAHVEESLRALNNAYYATLSYEEAVATDNPPSRDDQLRLAQAWDDFADKIRRYDNALYSRLRLKGRFWKEGANWSEEQKREAKIGLERIRQDTQFQLLIKQPKPRR